MTADAVTPIERLTELAAQLGPDALAALELVAQGLATGRGVYGEMAVATDDRCFVGEASAELRDSLVYIAAELLRLERVRRSVTAATRTASGCGAVRCLDPILLLFVRRMTMVEP